MRKILILCSVLSMYLLFSGIVLHASQFYPDIEPFITDEKNLIIEQSNLKMYVNYSSYTKENLEQDLNELDRKFLVFFNMVNTNNSVGYPEDLNHNLTIYYLTDVLNKFTIDCETIIYTEIVEECINFYREKIKELSSSNSLVMTLAEQEETFKLFYRGSERKTYVPYGYIDFDYELFQYITGYDSNLFLIKSHSSFVCGAMARQNGNSSYSENYYQYGDTVHIGAFQAKDYDESTMSNRMGGIPVLKDYWPENKPATCTITSSYQAGLNLGYSYTNGYSTSPEIKIENSMSVGANIGFAYSKSYTDTMPSLSVQKSSLDKSIVEWTYTYDQSNPNPWSSFVGGNPSLNWKPTCNAYQYYLFEMDSKEMYYRDYKLQYKLFGEFAERNSLGFKLGTRATSLEGTIEVYKKYIG